MTHYEILSISENASLSEIKAAHRRKALLYHPDRQLPQRFTDHDGIIVDVPAGGDKRISSQILAKCRNGGDKESVLKFEEVQLAWECLRDPEKKQMYDDSLKRRRERETAIVHKAACVNLSDMECELCDVELEEEDHNLGNSGKAKSETQNIYSYSCRCGDRIEILEEELNELNQEDPIILDCSSCSLVIQIIVRS
mmetsp:Transcript_24016/g.36601  ORF Transcript_24016/g.36601 Transcript_24016/m.36601 type:complete len:196 (-) Transcript_24016:6-593(-)